MADLTSTQKGFSLKTTKLLNMFLKPFEASVYGTGQCMQAEAHGERVKRKRKRSKDHTDEDDAQACAAAAQRLPGTMEYVNCIIDLFHKGETTFGDFTVHCPTKQPQPSITYNKTLGAFEVVLPVSVTTKGITADVPTIKVSEFGPHFAALEQLMSGEPFAVEGGFIQLPKEAPLGKWVETPEGFDIRWSGARAWQAGRVKSRFKAQLNWVSIDRKGAEIDLEWGRFFDLAANRYLEWA